MVRFDKGIFFCFIFILSWLIVGCDTSEQDLATAKKTNSIDAYEFFLTKHKHSDLVSEARDSLVNLYSRKNIKDIPINHQDTEVANRLRSIIESRADSLYEIAEYENSISIWLIFLQTVPMEYARDAEKRKSALVDEAYQKAKKTNTIEGWKAFVDEVPPEDARDAKKRISELEEKIVWSTESKAWQTASERGNAEAMRKYLTLYPKGIHARQAEKNLIDIEVASVFASEHGVLPAMDKGYSTGASYSIVEIKNLIQYDLTISYSGPDSKRLVIPPHNTRSMRIGNGNYRVAASVGHGVRPFAGNAYFDGSHFSSSFYIITTRY